MWQFGKRRRLMDEARRQFASNVLSPEGAELFERNEMPALVMEPGVFRFLIFQVEAETPEETQAEFCRAVDRILDFNGLLISLMSSVCLLVFRSKSGDGASDERDQLATVAFLQLELGNRVKIIYGTAGGTMGFLDLKRSGHYGVMLSEFPRILQRLSNSPAGAVEFYADTPAPEPL